MPDGSIANYIVPAEPIERDFAFGKGGQFTTHSAWREDKWEFGSARVGVTAPAGGDLKSFFFPEGPEARIQGVSQNGSSSHFAIENPADKERLAKSTGIPAEDIGKISYTENHGKISNVNVTYSDNVPPDRILENNGKFAASLEKGGMLPAGTAFEMDKAQIVDTGQVAVNTTENHLGQEKTQSIDFSAGHNSTGQSFTVKPSGDNKTSIAFGHDTPEEGRVLRSVSQDEFTAAQKLASSVGGTVHGEAGLTHLGVRISVDQPAQTVMNSLAEKGMIHPEVASGLEAKGLSAQLGNLAGSETHMAGAAARGLEGLAAREAAGGFRGALRTMGGLARESGGIGLAVAGVVGGVSAFAGGANAAEIGKASIDGALPGATAAAKGDWMNAAVDISGLVPGLDRLTSDMLRTGGHLNVTARGEDTFKYPERLKQELSGRELGQHLQAGAGDPYHDTMQTVLAKQYNEKIAELKKANDGELPAGTPQSLRSQDSYVQGRMDTMIKDLSQSPEGKPIGVARMEPAAQTSEVASMGDYKANRPNMSALSSSDTTPDTKAPDTKADSTAGVVATQARQTAMRSQAFAGPG